MFKIKVTVLKLNEITSEGFYFPSNIISQSVNKLSFPIEARFNSDLIDIIIIWERAEIEDDKLILYGTSSSTDLLDLLKDGVKFGVLTKGYADFSPNKVLKFIDITSFDITTEIDSIDFCMAIFDKNKII